MVVPRHRHTKSRRDRRRAHHTLCPPVLTRCGKCGQPVLPHRVCANCGLYRKREVIDVFAKLSKRERKKKEKELKRKEKEQEEARATQGKEV